MTPGRRSLLVGLALLPMAAHARAQVALPDARPVPSMQVIPLPDDKASIRREDRELTAYHFGPALRRPFLFPMIGPAGRSLTRMGHPHDPVTHSHHNSVWVAHHDVDGESFWDDRGPGRIVHRRIVRYDDGEDARIVALNAWVGRGGRVLMLERRGMTVRPMADGQWLLILDLRFEPEGRPVTLGMTPFGMVGVRMAKTVGVRDGGGRIRNSQGNLNEQGLKGAFRKRARWVDYSGPIAPGIAEGMTLFDHPSNPNHPSAFHVRDDGWMGASLTLDRAITIDPAKPLRLRYGLLVHAGAPESDGLERRWQAFAREPIADLPSK
jgi:hypothetical protein